MNPNAAPFDPGSPCSILEYDSKLVLRNDVCFEFFENEIGSYDSETFFEDQIPMMNPNAVPFESPNRSPKFPSFEFFGIIESEC